MTLALDGEVRVTELRAIGVVREDSAHARRRYEDKVRLLGLEERFHVRLPRQVQFGFRAQRKIIETLRLQTPHHGRSDHATMARHEDLAMLVQHHAL